MKQPLLKSSRLALGILFFAAPALAVTFNWPGTEPMSSRPATSPVDTRVYLVDGTTLEVDEAGEVLSRRPSDAPPYRLRAAISPAQIVFSDPDSGAVVGTSRYLNQTRLFGKDWRQYKAADGMYDLVDTDAVVRKVSRLPNGNFAVSELREEGEDEGLGQSSVRYVRSLWDTKKHPVFIFHPTPAVRTDRTLFEIKWPRGGNTPQGGGTPGDGAFSPAAPQAPQPRQPLSPEQKQLMASDIDMQISQLEGQLEQLRFDLIRAEGNRDRATITGVGWVGAGANVTQITSQINATQFRLNMLRQQRMMLMSQP